MLFVFLFLNFLASADNSFSLDFFFLILFSLIFLPLAQSWCQLEPGSQICLLHTPKAPIIQCYHRRKEAFFGETWEMQWQNCACWPQGRWISTESKIALFMTVFSADWTLEMCISTSHCAPFLSSAHSSTSLPRSLQTVRTFSGSLSVLLLLTCPLRRLTLWASACQCIFLKKNTSFPDRNSAANNKAINT